MEDCHQKVILDNIEKLMEHTDYDKLIKACVEAHILSPVMMNIIEEFKDQRERHKQLFIKLTKRGPTAYNAIVKVLEKLQYIEAAKILRPGEYARNGFLSLRKQNSSLVVTNNKINSNTESKTNHNQGTDGCIIPIDSLDESSTLKIYDDEVISSVEVKKSNKFHDGGKIPTYIMKSRYRGIFFLVNIIDFTSEQERRNGSDIDADSLIHLFREMGFITFYYKNLRQEKFHQLLDELTESKSARLADCFVTCIMSHGSMDYGVERVEFYGGSVEELTNIMDKFRNSVCPNLVAKPKIFIFPFCRGKISDRGMRFPDSPRKSRIETDHIEVKLPSNIPTYSDILICYASVPGYKTHRDPEEGSWYVQMFCKVFAEHAHDTHIEDLLKIVGEETGKIRTTDYKLQTASTVNYGFYKKLYFNPGYYED